MAALATFVFCLRATVPSSPVNDLVEVGTALFSHPPTRLIVTVDALL